MKTPQEIRQIAAWMSAAGLGALELRTPDERILLGKGGEPVAPRATPDVARRPPPGPHASAAGTTTVRAPSLGIFLRGHPGRATALAEPGMRVSKGQPVALLQIGPLLLPVPAPADGRLLAPRAAEGDAVGYGEPLFDFQQQ